MLPDPSPRWAVDPPNFQFFEWQRRAFELVNSRPVSRRIIWCWGEPNTGKTQFSQYLVDRLEGGCINFYSCLKSADLLHLYRGQGTVCFDFPRSFDWRSLSQQAACILEMFSEFGTSRTSTKYQGRSIRLQCHCLVLANIPPIDDIRHREVVEILCIRDEPTRLSRRWSSNSLHLDPTQELGPVRHPNGDLLQRSTGQPVGRWREDTLGRRSRSRTP